MMTIKDNIIELERTTDAFNYWFEGKIPAGETVYCKLPVVSANKRGINEIGWQCNSNDLRLYGTLSRNPKDTGMWSEIHEDYLINKTVSYLKAVNNGSTDCTLCLRVILN